MVKFDHIIHYVNDLEDVEAESVLPIHSGGKHERFGTANLLSYLDHRYIEYLAVEDKETFKHHLEDTPESFAKTIDTLGYEEGFIRYAISTDDIRNLGERYREKGFSVVGPVDMERITNGETISWKLLYIQDDENIFPFFIQWGEPEKERLERIRKLRGDLMNTPHITIQHDVRDVKVWEAFFDVIGIWKGEIDDHTKVELSHSEEPSITLELAMDGASVIYKGAVYKFI